MKHMSIEDILEGLQEILKISNGDNIRVIQEAIDYIEESEQMGTH